MLGREIGHYEFICAVLDGHIGIVSEFIEKNKDNPTLLSSDYTIHESPLCSAANRGHTEVVRLLLGAGVIHDARALINAARNGHIEVIRLLLEADFTLNAKVLTNAAGNGQVEVVRLLLDAGAPINDVDEYGYTALMRAASNGFPKVVRLLLDANAALNTANNEGETALICAAKRDRADALAMLLEAGADTTLKDKDHRTAEMSAPEMNNAIRHILQNDALEKRLESFEKKRASLVKTQVQTEEELQKKATLEKKLAKADSEHIEIPLTNEEIRIKGQLEKEKQTLQKAADLSFSAAISDINFLIDHRDKIDDFSLLPDLINRFSDLLAGLTEGDETLQNYSHTLRKVAAAQGHSIAQHIVENYKEVSTTVDIKTVREARLKLFGASPASSATTDTKSHQPVHSVTPPL